MYTKLQGVAKQEYKNINVANFNFRKLANAQTLYLMRRNSTFAASFVPVLRLKARDRDISPKLNFSREKCPL